MARKKKAKDKFFNKFLEQLYVKDVKGAQDLGRFLRENNISSSEAIRIIARTKKIDNTRGDKYNWKMMRFTLYLWQRIRELQRGTGLKSRIDSVRDVVRSDRYKRLYNTFDQSQEYDHTEEIKKLTQLIAERRQDEYFKEGLYKYEGHYSLLGGEYKKDTIIDQETINKIR